MKPDKRAVTVLVTLLAPDTADADDAATLIAAVSPATPGYMS